MKKSFLVIVLILTISFVTHINSVSALRTNSELFKMDLKYTKEEIENNANQTLLASQIVDLLKEFYNDSYPSYYGGIYISEDSKNVVLQIVEDNIPTVDSDEYVIYNKIINMGDTIQIKYVKNSYNEITELNNLVSDLVGVSSTDEIESNSIDVINNKVNIKLKENNSSVQKKY